MLVQPVVLCGGVGSRLWPLSREHYPKQLLRLCGEHTMLQSTVLRMQEFPLEEEFATAPPILVGNEEYRFLIADQIRSIRVQARLLLEPLGRNTAPALTTAALFSDPEAMLVVMPSDHLIRDADAFRDGVSQAIRLADAGKVVTFGVPPTGPETGYGYIKRAQALPGSAAYRVERFVEKPCPQLAQEYFGSGEYFWNAGVFIVKASVWLAHVGRLCPDILAACQKACAAAEKDRDFIRPDEQAYRDCPSDSIDFAVMEHLADGKQDEVLVFPLDAGWSDVGTWGSLWEVSDKGADGNALTGDVMTQGVRDSLVLAESRFVACLGLENVVVVETADAVLVASREKLGEIGQIVKRLGVQNRPEGRLHRKVHRPWGWYDSVDSGPRFQVKRIVVNPGGRLSLQLHHHRAEHWVVVRGTARVTRGEEVFLVTENESTYIPLGTEHRLENPGKVPLEMIEIQSGSYLGEDDIVRLEDCYGRS